MDELVNPSHEGDGDSAGAEVDADGWADGGNVTSFGLYHGFRICQQFSSYIRRVGVGNTQVNWCSSVDLLPLVANWQRLSTLDISQGLISRRC